MPPSVKKTPPSSCGRCVRYLEPDTRSLSIPAMAKGAEAAAVDREVKPSLVDIAEDSLRTWLASSRGTLRTALRRLEESGEIVRRQGSGTYVGRVSSDTFDEGLERLVSYGELARQRGVEMEASQTEIEELPVGGHIGELLGIDPAQTATTVTRVLLL